MGTLLQQAAFGAMISSKSKRFEAKIGQTGLLEVGKTELLSFLQTDKLIHKPFFTINYPSIFSIVCMYPYQVSIRHTTSSMKDDKVNLERIDTQIVCMHEKLNY